MTARRRLLVLVFVALLAAYARNTIIGTPSAGRLSGQAVSPPSLADLDAPDPVARIAIAYGVGDRSTGINELAWQGVRRFADVFEGDVVEVTARPDDTDAERVERLTMLAAAGYHPVFAVGSAYAGPLATVAPKFRSTRFVLVDDGSVNAPNVVGVLFNEEQGSFLVGAAAALTSKTGDVGFVGAVSSPLVQKFEAGFTAGARAADPDVKVRVAYLSRPPDETGFSDPAKARKAALDMYGAGADVIFAVAGAAGDGVIQAAHERGRWAIGVDTDQYQTADPSVRDSILTSMLKRVDIGTYTIGMEVAQGVSKDGNNVFGVGRDGVGYSTSGGFVDPIKAHLDDFAARIASGEILVPTKPASVPTPAP